MSWDAKFSEPIAVAGRHPLVTLRDAATFITALPKSDQDETRWQSAIHVLIQAADHGGPMEFARLGMAQALNPRVPVYDTSRKDPKWRNTRKLVRDLSWNHAASMTFFAHHKWRRAMSDDLKNKGQQDRSKIAMHEEHEVKYWTKHLGVSKEELQKAVDKVGNSAAAVRKELAA